MNAARAPLIDFRDLDAASRWTCVNDGVMGGVSSSGVTRTAQGTGLFAGQVSLEHNGGFASARTTLPGTVVIAGRGLSARVRGDGRSYQLRLRTDGDLDGVSYRFEFDTGPGEWRSVLAPFRQFVPTFRGRVVPGAPALVPARIRQVGFLIAGGQAGSFALEIDAIGVYE